MRLYLSADGDVLLMPDEPAAADDFTWRGVAYRVASAEWLTWLRENLDSNAARQRVGEAVKQHRPELLGCRATFPNRYAPPLVVGAGIRWFSTIALSGIDANCVPSSTRWDLSEIGTATDLK